MKSVMLVLLACVGLASCVVVPERVARVERSSVYVAPTTTYTVPSTVYVQPYTTYSYYHGY